MTHELFRNFGGVWHVMSTRAWVVQTMRRPFHSSLGSHLLNLSLISVTIWSLIFFVGLVVERSSYCLENPSSGRQDMSNPSKTLKVTFEILIMQKNYQHSCENRKIWPISVDTRKILLQRKFVPTKVCTNKVLLLFSPTSVHLVARFMKSGEGCCGGTTKCFGKPWDIKTN